MTVGKKIKELRKENRLTQSDLAKKLDVSFTTVSSWEREANKPMMDKLSIMAELFGVPISVFFDNEEFTSTNRIEISNITIKIPILGTIACGDPILAEQNIDSYTYELAETLPHGVIFGLIAKGDSMEPTIPNGATVLIREQSDVENGEIAAVLVNGDTEATLKRVKKIGSMIMLMPDNNKHDPIPITETKPARIIGKAVRVNINL